MWFGTIMYLLPCTFPESKRRGLCVVQLCAESKRRGLCVVQLCAGNKVRLITVLSLDRN